MPPTCAIALLHCRGASGVKKYQVYSVAPDGGIVAHRFIHAYCDEDAIAAVDLHVGNLRPLPQRGTPASTPLATAAGIP